MTEETLPQTAAGPIDPLGLNVNLREVDTTYPVAAAGLHPCTIKALEIVPKKDEPDKRNLMVTYALAQPVPAVAGPSDTVRAGYTFKQWLPLQQSDNPDAPKFEENLARFVDAVFNIKDAKDRPAGFPPFAEIIGRPVRVAVLVTEDDFYGKGNSVKNVVAAE